MHKEIPYTVLHNKDIPAKEVPTACATKEAPTATCTTKRYQQINILSHRHQSASLEVHLQRVSQGVRGVRRHHHRLVALVGHPNGEGRRARSLADTTLTAHRTTHATNQLDNKNIEQIIYTWYQVLRTPYTGGAIRNGTGNQLVRGFTLCDLLDKQWSQVSSLLPPERAFIFQILRKVVRACSIFYHLLRSICLKMVACHP